MKKKNYIVADCVCDLSKEYVARKNIGIIRFYLQLDTGRFMDGYEISYANVVEHYKNKSTMIVSTAPPAEKYAELYKEKLLEYDSIIHFTISTVISQSYVNAMEGRNLLGEDASRVHIVDTRTLSSGMSFMIMRALDMNDDGKNAEEIVKDVNTLIEKIHVTFVTPDMDNLVINERAPEKAAKLFKNARLHPVFGMVDGKLTIVGVEFGKREKYMKRYVKHCLKKVKTIDTERVFVTHAACSPAEIEAIKQEIKKYLDFKNVHVCTTSATVACNCGAGAFGVIYMTK